MLSRDDLIYGTCLGVITTTVLLCLALFVLSGCITTVITERPPYYTRYEVDAITAESNCRALARNMLQMERCSIRR